MSNGRQVGTIVGSLIAAYFTAGTSYAAFAVAAGGAAGGAIGGSFDPNQQVQGPRLEDLKVQYSNFGAGIPTLYGTERLAPNVFWSTDKQEVATTETQGGKGGGGGVENTTYKYYVNMRLLLCETPRDGSPTTIVKIFKDGKLIWDATSGVPVGSALASAENPAASFILYQGHQDQLPNPEEEAFHGGPGSVSAYRGVVSIYMRQIECPGGRVPQFSFVCSVNAQKQVTLYTGAPYKTRQFISTSRINTAAPTYFFDSGPASGGVMSTYAVGFDYGAVVGTSEAGFWSQEGTPGDADIDAMCVRLFDEFGADTGLNQIVQQGSALTRSFMLGADALVDGGHPCSWALRTTSNVLAFVSRYPTHAGGVRIKAFYWDSGTPIGSIDLPNINKIVVTDNYVWTSDGTTLRVHALDSSLTVLASASIPDPGRLWRMTGTSGDSLGICTFLINGASLYSATFSGGSISVVQTGDTPAMALPQPEDPIHIKAETIYYWSRVSTGGGYNTPQLNMLTFDQLVTLPFKAKDIIADQCERASELRYDVSALPDSDTVQGYKIAGASNARSNIDPILTTFGYFPVDEDGAIKFKRYADITSVATVTYDELGQSENGDSADVMPLQRTQEIDLPRSVTVSYIEPAKDFQTASEPDSRQVTEATEDLQIQLAVAISSDQAKKVAQMALYDKHRRQNQRATAVSRKFAFVSPGDGVTVEYPRGTFKLWLVLSVNDDGLKCEWTLVPGDAAIFTQTAVGATGYEGQQVAPLAAPTLAQILDIPMLRDVDNSAGPYVALDSYAPVPASAELFVGDDDTSLQSRGTVSASAPIGFAETVLASWSRNLVDETNTFTVNLGDDVFNSCTRDVLLANGGEFWAYGAPGRWEIGSSAQGDSLGDGRYILSRHLRGLFGTERNTGNHAAGDTFVLLRIAGMLRPDTGVGGIGQSKSYRAVTKGRSLNSVSSQTYANTGESLMPLSPINARRTSSNDLTVDRRSRMAMNNSTGAVPIGEAQERFSWEFYNSAFTSLLGTVVTNSSTATAAQITAIGVTPSATAYIKVRQISDSVGVGHELQATV